MESLPARSSTLIPDKIPIHDAHLLATLWEEQELSERLDQLKVIAEHIDLHNADLTIVVWEKFLALIEDVDRRYVLNLDSARKNALHMGIELRDENEGIDALKDTLSSIKVSDTTRFAGASIHPGRHLVCNIGVLRADTVMKTAYSLVRSTHATEPTIGLQELVSRLERHRQTLESEIHRHQVRMVMGLSEQGHVVRTFELIPELQDFKRLGIAYWSITGQVIP